MSDKRYPSQQEQTPAPPEDFFAGDGAIRPSSLWRDAWRRLKRNWIAMIGLAIVITVVLVAICAPLIAPYDPVRLDSKKMVEKSLLKPGSKHLMGTDILGRDIFSRVVYGSRVSLLIGIGAVSIMIALGIVAGALAGYYGGFIDAVIMRLADIFFAFPYVLGSIALITVLGFGARNIIIAIGILGWPSIARVFRSSILLVKENEYIYAARAVGASDVRIMFRHVLPNAVAPIIVYGTMSIGGAILTEAALSFLGIGVQPPTPAWGYMLSESRSYIFTAPWLMIFPGLAIFLTVLGFVLLGDGLQDAFDPRLKE